MANTEQQIQSLASQVQQLTAQLTSQQQELNKEQQAQATSAALTVAQSDVSQLTAALQQIRDWARDGQWEQKVSSVLDLLDARLDPREVEKARDIQMATLIEKDFAKARLKADMPRKAKFFNFKWVDEIKRGVYRSRFTCADIKKKCSKEELAEETNTFAPTPYEESHILLELKCFRNGWHSRSGDVRCAYLLGADSGDSNGQPVFMRMPPEYLPHFYAWLDAQDSETKALRKLCAHRSAHWTGLRRAERRVQSPVAAQAAARTPAGSQAMSLRRTPRQPG